MSGNGWALLSGSLHLTSGLELKDWGDLPSEKVAAVLYAVGLGIVMFCFKLLLKRHFPIALPVLIAIGTTGVYIIMGVHSYSIDDGKARGHNVDGATSATHRPADLDLLCTLARAVLPERL